MKIKKTADCDVLVIGAGMAGCIAAARASSLGMKTIQAGNSSSFFFASGLFDLLGVFPVETGKIVDRPCSAIAQLQSEQRDHPYSKTTVDQIKEGFEFLASFLDSASLPYSLPGTDNRHILTSLGTFKPTYMVPQTVSKGCNLEEKNILIVDFKGLRGFSAKQVAAGLATKNRQTQVLTIEVPENLGNLNPVHLATAFEKKEFIQHLADKLLKFSGKADIVGLPAVCGIHNSLEITESLEKKTGMDVFEIPGMPPSIPGLRLKNAFEKKLSGLGTLFLSNAKIIFHAMEKDHFILRAVNDNFETRIKAQGVILATGRFPGGGLFARRDIILETVFDLPVFQPETREMWHQLNFLDPKGHLINQAGLETDEMFRPLDKAGKPAFENLYAAGSIIAHNDWTRLKCGAGVACISAYTAVNSFYKRHL